MKLRQRKKNIRKFLVSKEIHPFGCGVQYIYRFPNNKGASVIKFELFNGLGSYGCDLGLYEMAHFHFDEDGTPAIKNVDGYLTPKDVIVKLERIMR